MLVLGLGFGNKAPEEHEGEEGDCLMDITEGTKLGRVLVSVLVNALWTSCGDEQSQCS